MLLRRRGEPGDGPTEELAIRVDKERSEQREAFTDNVIMYEVLSELKDMAGRGGVRCTCGSRDYGIRHPPGCRGSDLPGPAAGGAAPGGYG